MWRPRRAMRRSACRTRLIHRLFRFFALSPTRFLAHSLLLCRSFASLVLALFLSLSPFLLVLHKDWALLHSCTVLSVVTELVLDHSSTAFAVAQGASQNRVPFDTLFLAVFWALSIFTQGLLESWSLSCEQLSLAILVVMEVCG